MSGDVRATAAKTSSRSRRSTKLLDERRGSRCERSKSEGDVCGVSDKPCTSAPFARSQCVSHVPLNPVCPVTSTVLAFQNPAQSTIASKSIYTPARSRHVEAALGR